MRGEGETTYTCCCAPEPPPSEERIFKLCDGSQVSYFEEWVPRECDECGRISGFDEIGEPDFHLGHVEKCENGERRWDCCGQFLVSIELLNQIALERMIPAMLETFEKTSPLLDYLKGKR